MGIKVMQEENIGKFKSYLLENEKSLATVAKYVSEIEELKRYLKEHEISKAHLIAYREKLCENCKAQTVNVKMAAINKYVEFIGMSECKLKYIRIQRRAFRDENKELTENEYKRLLEAAVRLKKFRLYYLMLTLCGTGIRISELMFITVEAVKSGSVEISLKGKTRIVLIPKELRKMLNKYIEKTGIQAGIVFCTRNGKPVDRSNVCHEMKKLCEEAKVKVNKAFPHNLRHLFAKAFYAVEKNLAL